MNEKTRERVNKKIKEEFLQSINQNKNTENKYKNEDNKNTSQDNEVDSDSN